MDLIRLFVSNNMCPQVQFRAASNVCDKLTEAELRLINLLEEVDSRKSELGNVAISEVMCTYFCIRSLIKCY